MNKKNPWLLLFLLPLLSCNAAEIEKQAIPKLHVGMTWQWQLSGKLNPDYQVDLYDVDLFDTSTKSIQALKSSNKMVICYFSAGSYEDWRKDKSQFNKDDLGKPLDGWEGERWLDIRQKNVRQIMQKRMDLAKQKGCDGVEPDNVDGFDNPNGLNLTASDQLDYNRFLANQAHIRGLKVALKNDMQQVTALVNDFDFSVNEECHEYNECDVLKAFIEQDKPVFNAEYKKAYINDISIRKSMCEQSKVLKIQTLVLPLDLDDSFRLACS